MSVPKRQLQKYGEWKERRDARVLKTEKAARKLMGRTFRAGDIVRITGYQHSSLYRVEGNQWSYVSAVRYGTMDLRNLNTNQLIAVEIPLLELVRPGDGEWIETDGNLNRI